MLYHLLYSFKDINPFFNVFRYITFRSVLAAVTAFLISIILGPFIIKKLAECKIVQQIRGSDVSAPLHDMHKDKAGTPTMGGIVILLSILTAVFLWGELNNRYVFFTLLVMVWLGIAGFIDDYIKLKLKRSKGLGILAKFIMQCSIGIVIGFLAYCDPNLSTRLDVPFFKNIVLNLGIFYIVFVTVVIVGASNAVNLTDGLDGLAIGCTIMVALAYSVLCYVSGHAIFSTYLFIPHIPGTSELAVICASIVGAGLGFLWFNCHPASVFMGDIGSLSLGGALGVVAVFIRKELLLMIVGGIFVMEALSVILQVASYRLRNGKRIFKCSPLHHHFQMLGWHENKIIVRFWIVGAILAVLTLMTLKLR